MTHYDEFDVSPTATPEEIRQAHRNLARLLHPDPLQDSQLRRLAEHQMKRVNQIYAILSDPAQRRGYDLQLALGTRYREAPPPTARWRGAAPWVIAAAGVLFGLYPHWQRPAAPAARASLPVEEYVPPSTAVNGRTPRKAPVRAVAEADRRRDQGAGREAPPRRRPLAAAPETTLGSRAVNDLPPAAHPPAATSPASFPAVPAMTVVAEAPPPPLAASDLPYAGTWLFVPGNRKSGEDLYPPEYIELTVARDGDFLWGHYRARYRVTDRAISPEVNFEFESKLPAPERIAWSGNGGAKGEVRLKMLSENRLSVDWFTKSFGHSPALGSGTAVLVRRDAEK
ncbi:MAG: J domain-containing protein [Bryobacteraceae bacterium]